jgi:mannose-6-phosphate isomerase
LTPRLLELPPNRARRNYRGGKLLDLWEGKPAGEDGDQPEDWLASTTPASNPGLPPVEDEGLATVEMHGSSVKVRDLFAEEPAYWLGVDHFKRIGPRLGFLVKLLDSAMRLHVQVHPTREFAQQYLNSRWGKLESYVVLAVRDEVQPFIRLGFQRPPSLEEWARIIREQDIAAMDACFDPVPVAPGEVWLIPGGLPHAIGPGLLVLETLEPTDLVVRCEFEREGIVVPPPARFMGHDADDALALPGASNAGAGAELKGCPPGFALKMFDMTPRSVREVTERYRVGPSVMRADRACRVENLIGRDATDCFAVQRVVAAQACSHDTPPYVHVGVVTSGSGVLGAVPDALRVRRGTRFLMPAVSNRIDITPDAGEELEVILVRPGDA